jgi:hypothetical protein
MLLIIPILLFIVLGVLQRYLFPLNSGPIGYDPAYAYLFNGLLILNGDIPQHIDHPGTPLQILISITVAAQWLLLKIIGLTTLPLNNSVALSAEKYLLSISWVLILMNCLAVYYLGRRIYLVFQRYSWALIAQLVIFIYPISLSKLPYPATESILVVIANIMIGYLAPAIFIPKTSSSRILQPTGWVAGVLGGIGVAVKLTYFPMLILLGIIRPLQQLGKAILATIFSFFVGILLVITKLTALYAWLLALLIHTGLHGEGGTGFIELANLKGIVFSLITSFWVFYSLQVLLVLAIAYRWISSIFSRNQGVRIELFGQGTFRCVVAVIATCLLQTILLIKHPAHHYLIAVLPVTSLLILMVLSEICLIFTDKAIQDGFAIALLSGLFIYSMNNVYVTVSNFRMSRIAADVATDAIEHELKKYPAAIIVGAHQCTLPECALSQGTDFAQEISPKLGNMFGNFYQLNITNMMMAQNGSAKGSIPASDVQLWLSAGKTVFIVSPRVYPELDVFNLQTVIKSPAQSLYRALPR